MAKFETGQKLLHVQHLGSEQRAAVIRTVTCKGEVSKDGFYVPCWIPDNNSRQLLGVFELYPDTPEMRAKINEIEDEAQDLRAGFKRLNATIYQLRNSLSK